MPEHSKTWHVWTSFVIPSSSSFMTGRNSFPKFWIFWLTQSLPFVRNPALTYTSSVFSALGLVFPFPFINSANIYWWSWTPGPILCARDTAVQKIAKTACPQEAHVFAPYLPSGLLQCLPPWAPLASSVWMSPQKCAVHYQLHSTPHSCLLCLVWTLVKISFL